MPTPRRVCAVAYAWKAVHGTAPPPELDCGPATVEDAQAEPAAPDEKRAAERWRRAAGQRTRRAAAVASAP
ncbi:MAG: hypothetical protein ACRET5_10350 [Steroidobacteraceae bacterium]